MGRAYFLDCLREIKGSLGRFLAIFAIAAIGVAFFAGVWASSADMKYSADQYFDEYHLMDLSLLSPIGFTKEDVAAIRGVKGVQGVFATDTLDVLVQLGATRDGVKVMTLPLKERNEEDEDYINRLKLVEGRLPEKSGECVVKAEKVRENVIQLGDTLTLTSGTDADLSDTLVTDTYTVVGYVDTPYYLSYEMGTTTIGNGKISYCIVIPESDFVSDGKTQVFVTVEGVRELNSYEDAYFDQIAPVVEELKQVGKARIAARIDEMKQQIEEQVPDPLRATYEEEVLGGSADWKWYVLDRNSHYSYRDYGATAERMENIAKVFPVFFIFVAALVCLTTMTRMVEEQRGTIGTLKALGYGKIIISWKYISYAMSASLLGSCVGCKIGLRVFPTIIYTSWNIMYNLPPISFADQTVLGVVSVAAMTGIITLAALLSVLSVLRETPALLMRPKAPKNGKKILLEHITPLWKHVSFTGKVTARNIFRYKKRFFMTVIGVAGCSALLLAGYGIKDSISCLIRNQYGEIMKYDVSVAYEPQIVTEGWLASFGQEPGGRLISDYLETNSQTAKAGNGAEDVTEQEVTLLVFSETKRAEQFLTLRERKKHTRYELTDQGAIISEKLSKDLKIKKGDRLLLENGDGVRKEAVVSEICEMYVNHYVFLTEEYYRTLYGETPAHNCVLAILAENTKEAEEQLGQGLLEQEGVISVTFFSGSIERFDDMIQALDLVTYVLLISAALLAFIVLYNLTNVNVSERLREIATIKVLGFYDHEVSAYVYRENLLITVIGALAGLLLGVALHAFIMEVIEMDSVMFGNAIEPGSFGKAFFLTLLFSVLVNLFMYGRLKRIPMVESLKSVE